MAEIIMSHFNPISGKRNEPAKTLQVLAKLLTEQRRAKDVDSRPGLVFCAIKSSIKSEMNIPITLKITLYAIAE
jgi:hypothetical protein